VWQLEVAPKRHRCAPWGAGVCLAATVVLAGAVRTGRTRWRVSQLNESINRPKRTLERCSDLHSSEPASGVRYLWNRKEARDETLANRGNFGSRLVLKRDCACFKERQARASPHSYHVL
jgi:hypothetical protein